jgi:hypothetical protein
LHFGSLLAAVASYLQARVNHGTWLLRVEDIDPPREQPGAVKRIIDALQAYGFAWDGPVTYQSQFAEHHETLVQHLLDAGLAYPCSCSRRDLASARRGPLGAIYPGTCRNGCHDNDVAIRVRTDDEPIRFVDLLQGEQSHRLESESGDFVIKRRDGLIAYQLAVVVDDHDQGITEVEAAWFNDARLLAYSGRGKHRRSKAEQTHRGKGNRFAAGTAGARKCTRCPRAAATGGSRGLQSRIDLGMGRGKLAARSHGQSEEYSGR